MPAGPFVHIPGKVAAGQITVAALKGLALAAAFGIAYKFAVMDDEHKKINHHYLDLAKK